MKNNTFGLIDLLKEFFRTNEKPEKPNITKAFYDDEFDLIMSETNYDKEEVDYDVDYEDILY